MAGPRPHSHRGAQLEIDRLPEVIVFISVWRLRGRISHLPEVVWGHCYVSHSLSDDVRARVDSVPWRRPFASVRPSMRCSLESIGAGVVRDGRSSDAGAVRDGRTRLSGAVRDRDERTSARLFCQRRAR